MADQQPDANSILNKLVTNLSPPATGGNVITLLNMCVSKVHLNIALEGFDTWLEDKAVAQNIVAAPDAAAPSRYRKAITEIKTQAITSKTTFAAAILKASDTLDRVNFDKAKLSNLKVSDLTLYFYNLCLMYLVINALFVIESKIMAGKLATTGVFVPDQSLDSVFDQLLKGNIAMYGGTKIGELVNVAKSAINGIQPVTLGEAQKTVIKEYARSIYQNTLDMENKVSVLRAQYGLYKKASDTIPNGEGTPPTTTPLNVLEVAKVINYLATDLEKYPDIAGKDVYHAFGGSKKRKPKRRTAKK
jgi:hypothetical protein